jgi:hypothetical protein
VFASQLSNASADPISDLRALSLFKDADLNRLAGGDVLAKQRSPVGRSLTVESAYVLRAPLKTAVSLHTQWNPSRHPELRVYMQSDIGRSGDFQRLASAPSNSAVRAFVEATQRLPNDPSKLQLSNAEARMFVPESGGGGGGTPTAVVSFWNKVLSQRLQSFLSGGLSAEPPYETGGSTLRVSDEVGRLIQESGSVRSQFGPIISATPVGGGRGSPSGYWTLFDVDGMAAVSLNASYGKAVGDGWQAMDLGYYASGGFYALVTLYQMWPVKVDNQDATLVWRVDLTSASAIGNLRGVERLGSGAAMMRDIQKNVKAFVRESGGSR